MNTKILDKLSSLSPFELKDELLKLAALNTDKPILNAGRGNPNFLATTPRHGFYQLGLFAMMEAERSFAYMPEGVGGFPLRNGIEQRFEAFFRHNAHVPGVHFLHGAVSYVRDHLGYSDGDFIQEMCEGILGCNYPVPDRMLTMSEKIVAAFVHKEMIGNYPGFDGEIDLFAVEGGTAAMTYLFNTFRENGLVVNGDTIALGMPIFTPYIEIPDLPDYGLSKLYIHSDPALDWQYPDSELDKLLDPRVKVFCLVNPSNPPSVKLCKRNMEQLVEIAKKRPDLIFITDDVYGTFADDFTSLFAYCPQNTILVYSFSKYYGATGWRLGFIATHQNNILDTVLLPGLDESSKLILDHRYESITPTPRAVKFIDRVVADSRTVALNHTAGLSTPQQVQMVLFTLFSLMDTPDAYKDAMKRIVRNRRKALYKAMGVVELTDENTVGYYEVLDLQILGSRLYGQPFVNWLLKRLQPNEFLFNLAERYGVVLMPGKGFGALNPSVRVSLANLIETDYAKIGKALRKMMSDYYQIFQEESK